MSIMQKPLEDEYTAEFDTVGKHEWYKILDLFSDTNIYQTWSYDMIRCGEANMSHLVLLKADKIIAAAQVRIIRIPILGHRVAYIYWGPFWQLRNQPLNPIAFRLALRALRNEYVCRRGMILRIFPVLYNDNNQPYADILSQEGYSLVQEESSPRTLIMDISQAIDDIRKRFDQKWRNCLNKSERNNLDVIEGTNDALFANFVGLYRSLLDRKKFQEPNDINEFRMIQQDLPSEYKMRIFLCQSNGVSSAGVICATIGETGVYLFGATNDHGMTNKGSYLLQWKAIQWMKNNGCLYYNLNGINPLKNPGSYHFKIGLSGKNGRDLYYLGKFDCWPGIVGKMLTHVVSSVWPRLKKYAFRR